MITFIIWAIVAYCLYKFIFRFLLPVIVVSRRMKKQVREFQRHANGQFQNYQKDNVEPPEPKPTQKSGDYIDFEEIKEK